MFSKLRCRSDSSWQFYAPSLILLGVQSTRPHWPTLTPGHRMTTCSCSSDLVVVTDDFAVVVVSCNSALIFFSFFWHMVIVDMYECWMKLLHHLFTGVTLNTGWDNFLEWCIISNYCLRAFSFRRKPPMFWNAVFHFGSSPYVAWFGVSDCCMIAMFAIKVWLNKDVLSSIIFHLTPIHIWQVLAWRQNCFYEGVPSYWAFDSIKVEIRWIFWLKG